MDSLNPKTFRKRLHEHSLSLILLACFAVALVFSYIAEQPGWLYDFYMMLAGAFGGSLVIVVFARYFWERGSDPAKPTDRS